MKLSFRIEGRMCFAAGGSQTYETEIRRNLPNGKFFRKQSASGPFSAVTPLCTFCGKCYTSVPFLRISPSALFVNSSSLFNRMLNDVKILACASLLSVVCAGCNSETPQVAQRDAVEVIPALQNETIDAEPVSVRKVSRPRVLLNEGDRFVYQRTVEQSLGAEPGSPLARVREKLETRFSIGVAEVRDDSYLLEVQFLNVRYQSELGDRRIVFDSQNPSDAPPEALPYRGLLENGFIIVMGDDNRIRDIQGYAEFLQRCYRDFPPSMQWELIHKMGGYAETPAARVAAAMSFLDESFALLPYGQLVEGADFFPVGASWSREQQRVQPIAVWEALQLNLSHVTDELAHVSLTGGMQPATQQKNLGSEGVLTHLRGGTLAGSCTLDLRTGLPKTCTVHRNYELEMTALRQPPVSLKKSVDSTLELLPTPMAAPVR